MKRILFIALLLPALAFAELNPAKGVFDARVRVVDYNPADVVKLTTFYGVSTHVQFHEKETIENVAVGDVQAWDIVPRGNHLFIKPKAQRADTNVTVVTNNRVYQFVLMVQPEKLSDATAWRNQNLVFSLSFRYPDEESSMVTAAAKADETKKRLDAMKGKLKAGKAGETNRDYWVAGSEEVSPTGARDDGRFMYLAFSNNRDMPAVYAVDNAGNESLVNTNVEGNEIVIQRMVRQLRLRKGTAVACVVNKSFDLNGGMDNTTGTVAPDVERVIKGAQ